MQQYRHQQKRFTEYKWKFTKTGQTRGRHPPLHSWKNNVVKKRDNTRYLTSGIVPVYQGYQKYCGGQSETEACTAIPETDNKR